MIYNVKNEDKWFKDGIYEDLTFITEVKVEDEIISIERLHLNDLEGV